MLKKMASLLLAMALVPVGAFSASAAASTVSVIKVQYNQKPIVFPDQEPVIRNNRTLVPIRPIAETLGFEVDWNENTRTVTIKKGTNQVRLVVSQKIAKKNGQTINLDTPAQIINKRTVVPVRFIAEALNYKVDWNQASQTVLIADQQQTVQPTEPSLPTVPTLPVNQPSTEQPKKEADFIDEESIEAKHASLMGLSVFLIKGKVDPDVELTVSLNDKTYEVDVQSDGSFKFERWEKISAEDYKITATKNGETDVLEGIFKVVQ